MHNTFRHASTAARVINGEHVVLVLIGHIMRIKF